MKSPTEIIASVFPSLAHGMSQAKKAFEQANEKAKEFDDQVKEMLNYRPVNNPIFFPSKSMKIKNKRLKKQHA